MKKKRKLKTLLQRRPKDYVHLNDISDKVAENLGFQKCYTKEIVDEIFKVISDEIDSGKMVSITKLGMLYKYITPERTRQGFDGVKPYPKVVPAEYTVKFALSKILRDKVQEKSPTEEEVNNLYRD